MIAQDFILLIANCEKYKYKAERQKNDWLKQLPSTFIYYHIIGNEKLHTEFMFDNILRILYVKCKDDYNSLPKKMILAFKAIKETFRFKYVFKTDDDQQLNNVQFLNVVKNIVDTSFPKIHYGGQIIDVKENYISEYHTIHPELPKDLKILKTRYCSGRFYILSNSAVVNLVSKKELIVKEYLEDYAVGYYLDTIYKQNALNLMSTKFFTDYVFATEK
jgi:uncharacterized protein YcgL (UPF0745 family)